MLKTMTVNKVGLVIGSLIMIELNQNTRGTCLVKRSGNMITLTLRMIVGGMTRPNMGISIQTKILTLSTMSIIEVEDSMITWISRMTMTDMINILIAVVNMIRWTMMITIMSVQHLSPVKGRELEIWSVNIDTQIGHFLGRTSTEAANTVQLVSLLVRFFKVSELILPFLYIYI